MQKQKHKKYVEEYKKQIPSNTEEHRIQIINKIYYNIKQSKEYTQYTKIQENKNTTKIQEYTKINTDNIRIPNI